MYSVSLSPGWTLCRIQRSPLVQSRSKGVSRHPFFIGCKSVKLHFCVSWSRPKGNGWSHQQWLAKIYSPHGILELLDLQHQCISSPVGMWFEVPLVFQMEASSFFQGYMPHRIWVFHVTISYQSDCTLLICMSHCTFFPLGLTSFMEDCYTFSLGLHSFTLKSVSLDNPTPVPLLLFASWVEWDSSSLIIVLTPMDSISPIDSSLVLSTCLP